MSWHFSRALEAGFSAANCSAGEPSQQWKSMPSAPDDSCSDKMKGTWHRSPFGTMYVPSTDGHGAALLTWFQQASRARTSAPQELAQALMVSAPAYGAKWHALPAKFDLSSSGWKTAHSLWEEDLPWSSVILPSWGCMRDGECWEPMTLALPTSESACGFLPTPTRTDANGRTYHYSRGDKTKAVPSLVGVVKLLPTPAASDWKGQYTWETVKRRMSMARGVRLPEELSRRVGKAITPNPEFWEWMMGWPIGSTASQPLETAKFQLWLQQHGGFSAVSEGAA